MSRELRKQRTLRSRRDLLRDNVSEPIDALKRAAKKHIKTREP
jgi:hypothetical protein